MKWNIYLAADLSVLQRHNLRVVGAADDRVVVLDGRQTVGAEKLLALGRVLGEELPGAPAGAVVHRALEHPQARPRTVRHHDRHVGHVELLSRSNFNVRVLKAVHSYNLQSYNKSRSKILHQNVYLMNLYEKFMNLI